MREIDGKIHHSSEHVTVDLFVPGKFKGTTSSAIAQIICELHLIDDLKAKALFDTDVMEPEEMILDLGRHVLTIDSCDSIKIPLSITPKGRRMERAVRILKQVTLTPHTMTTISIRLRRAPLPEDRDYCFYGVTDENLGLEKGFLDHIVDAYVEEVQVRNSSNRPLVIPKNRKVGMIRDFEEEGCYTAHVDDIPLAVRSSSRWNRLEVGLTASLAAVAAFTGSVANPFFSSTSDSVAKDSKTAMPNNVTVYENQSAYSRMSTIVDAYPDIWRDSGGVVDVSEEDWMPIKTIPEAKLDPAKVYPLSPEDRALINKEFDQYHAQGKMEWTKQATPYGFPVSRGRPTLAY